MANEPRGLALTKLAFPKRAVNALERGGIRTLEEAAEWSDDALLSLPHIGRTFVAALRAAQHNPEH